MLSVLFAASQAQICTVDWNTVHQKIDGFGGGVVFLNPGSLDPVTSANMDTLFLTNTSSQLGLSLLRIRIDSSTNWLNGLLDGQKAVARGARVLATPWSPPKGMKNNGSTIAGSLLTSKYATYAGYLNTFAGYMKANGAPNANNKGIPTSGLSDAIPATCIIRRSARSRRPPPLTKKKLGELK